MHCQHVDYVLVQAQKDQTQEVDALTPCERKLPVKTGAQLPWILGQYRPKFEMACRVSPVGLGGLSSHHLLPLDGTLHCPSTLLS